MGTKLSTDERRKLRVRRQLKKWRTDAPGSRFTGRQSIFTRKLSTIRQDALWRRPQPKTRTIAAKRAAMLKRPVWSASRLPSVP
ncbi:MAG: hypothetical protein CM15mP21_6650 [Hyphomicrobiales bacterium]|nr:MAG: hypothetical protein CM15mP21_6650 [Hyphomicrobiales bacterium]